MKTVSIDFHYQSLYLVPSSAVPFDLVCTSKTLLPSQESESGSSCMERRPQSVSPIIGSVGIRRKNFNFFPPTSTPLTKVSRSGGYCSDPALVWNAPRSAASL